MSRVGDDLLRGVWSESRLMAILGCHE